MNEAAEKTVRIIVYAICGFFLMFPLGYLFDTMEWPLFHSWGLVHGTFFMAWPALSYVVYLVVRVTTKLFKLLRPEE